MAGLHELLRKRPYYLLVLLEWSSVHYAVVLAVMSQLRCETAHLLMADANVLNTLFDHDMNQQTGIIPEDGHLCSHLRPHTYF
jgi:hypothetical protein